MTTPSTYLARRAVARIFGRVCSLAVSSDDERGGWRVDCWQHGYITTRDNLGAASASATDHAAKHDRKGA